MKVLLFLTIISLGSCASYINRVHKQIDQGYEKQAGPKLSGPTSPHFDMYRRSPRGQLNDKRPIKDPKTYNRFSQNPSVSPKIARNYQPQTAGRKRYTANDFSDDGNEASLWAGEGRENYLFSQDETKRPGDIIIISVQENLKNAISSELRRVFPKPSAPQKGQQDKKPDPNPNRQTASNEEDNEEATDLNGKVYDKISSQIMEDLSSKYISLSGVKEVLFRKEKHLIRVQAVAPKNALSEDDTVLSEKLLETKVYVLR